MTRSAEPATRGRWCNTGTHCYVIVGTATVIVVPVSSRTGLCHARQDMAAPRRAVQDVEANKRPVERRVVGRTREVRRRGRGTGQTAAAAMVVARGVDTTPAPTEEESAQYAATVAHAVSMAKLRKRCSSDVDFESAHGRAATNERLGSKTRARTLGDYLVAESEARCYS